MRRTTWIVFGAIAAAAMASSAFGYAASHTVGTKTLGGTNASVAPCDADGVTIVHNLSGSNVASVTIASIASACANASLSVNVNNGSANSSGSGTVPAGGG